MIDVSTYSKPANLPGFLVKLIRSSRVESSLRYGGDGQKFHHRCFRSMNFEGVHKKASVVTLDDGGNHQHLGGYCEPTDERHPQTLSRSAFPRPSRCPIPPWSSAGSGPCIAFRRKSPALLRNSPCQRKRALPCPPVAHSPISRRRIFR